MRHSYDDVARFVPFFDKSVGFHNLVQRIESINDHLDLSHFH
jgi:hypothetical protein